MEVAYKKKIQDRRKKSQERKKYTNGVWKKEHTESFPRVAFSSTSTVPLL